jgi:polysaccharide chain length determinant protein (PEP-CTERM system associated)
MSSDVHLNTPGGNEKEFSLGEILEIAIQLVLRRRWWILGGFTIVTLAAISVILLMPDSFESEATVAVVDQQISTKYVDSDLTPVDEALSAMQRRILSRTSLLAVIDQLNLYPGLRGRLSPDDLAAVMLEDLTVEPQQTVQPGAGVPRVGALRVAYVAPTPDLAQQVVSRITSMFIEENMKMRGEEVSTTTDFIADQVREAGERLAERDRMLQDFKARNLGQLPEQQGANLQMAGSLSAQLMTTTSNLNRLRDQKATLLSGLDDRIAAVRTSRDTLLRTLTDRHPEVLKKDEEIRRLESVRNALRDGVTSPDVLALEEQDPTLATVRSQLQANRAEIERYSQEEKRLREQMEAIEDRVQYAPVTQARMTALEREYNLARDEYNDLKSRQSQSQLTARLEERQEGQHFRLVDSPSLPLRPFKPERMRLSALAAFGGILFGLVLGVVIDGLDHSYGTEKAVLRDFDVPLVVGIPLLHTPRERKQSLRKAARDWAVALALICLVLAAELYVYRVG